jgi:RNA polymerase sigma factor (sigma-70 family)
MKRDSELLCQFVDSRSDQAFAELVRRHMDAVYSAARRQVRDGQLAEDVAQAVFLILARKAAKLQDRDSLAGWLMKTTHLASLDAIKVASRRKRHEQRAAEMAASHPERNMPAEISSELDRALARLNEVDRSAITLRFFEGKSIEETADSLGIADSAAAKRVSRAIERLRTIFVSRGIIAPTVAIAVVLDQVPKLSAPAALAGSTIAAATSGAAAPAGLLIAKGTMQMITIHKILAAMLLIAALAGVTGLGVGAAKLLADDQKSSPAAPPTPAANIAPSQPAVYRGTLSNGVSFELLGVGENPADGKQWWLANGDLLNTPPFAHLGRNASVSPMDGTILREFAISYGDAVAGSRDPATIGWDVRGSKGIVYVEDSSPATTEIFQGAAARVPDSPGGVTVGARVAAGPWKTLFTAPGTGHLSEGAANGSILFSGVFVENRMRHIVIAYTGQLPDNQDMRVVAIDRAGNVVRGVDSGSATGQNGYVGEFAVSLQPSAIREWQVQSRPFDQWIEIRNVSLHAALNTNATVVTSDDQKNP